MELDCKLGRTGLWQQGAIMKQREELTAEKIVDMI